jgi:biotin carboxyl carrier protein
MKYITTIGDQEFLIDINDEGYIEIDGERLKIDFQGIEATQLYSLIIDGESYEAAVDDRKELYHVMLKSTIYEVHVEDERTRRLAGIIGGPTVPVGELLIKAPMPGVVVTVPVTEGQYIAQNDIVVVLESMKMQNEFKTPRVGTVSCIRVKPGDKGDQYEIVGTSS